MFHLLEIVQPQKPESEHALDFLRVSTFVCSRNKHSCLLSITECPQSHYGLVLHAVNLSIWQPVLWLLWWRFNWIFWVIIKTGGVEKDTHYNLSSFSPHYVIRSLIFDRIQDRHSTFLPLCVENKMMLCYELFRLLRLKEKRPFVIQETCGVGCVCMCVWGSFSKTYWLITDKLLTQNVQWKQAVHKKDRVFWICARK